MISVVRFTCPCCGGHEWRASLYVDVRIGRCLNVDCEFRWPRTDDWRFFSRVTGRKVLRFRNAEEYELADAADLADTGARVNKALNQGTGLAS